MASASCSETPSNVRHLRAARSNFEAPSFSLGIETETFRSIPSFEEFPESSSRRAREEEKSCKLEEEHILVQSDSEDDFQPSRSQQQRRFKRLKRGPASARKEALKVAHDLSIFARRHSKDVSEEPLPFVKDSRNKNGHVAGIETLDFGQEHFQTISGERVLPSSGDHKNCHKRSEPQSSLASGETLQCSRDFFDWEVPKFGSQREGGSTGGSFSLNRDPIRSVQNARNNSSENFHASSNGDGDVDDIEEFSDDELFGTGSRTQRYGRSLRPQISGPNPILLSSSPETSQKQKPVLQIPGADIPPKVSLKLSQPPTAELPSSEEDTLLIDDFFSESGWRRTRPDLSKPAQTPQQLKKSASDNLRANFLPNLFKTSQRDSFREATFKSFHTETPARRDIVGPPQVFRSGEINETEEDRIRAFLSQRFPHYKPVDALLVDGGLDNEPVYIDYRNQFAEGRGSSQLQSGNTSTRPGARWPVVRSINEALSASPSSIPAQRRTGGNRKGQSKGQPKRSRPGKVTTSAGRSSRPRKRASGASLEGWRTVNGSRVYIVAGQKITGQRAYAAYKKRGGSSKRKNKKRPSTKSN